MKEENSYILTKLGKDPGFKVPEHYFDDFNKRMAESLPEVKITPVDARPSMWVRVRPYVYMAAMFAGIWCMMKVFNNVPMAGRLRGEAGIWCMMKVFNNFNGESSRQQQACQISAGVQNERNADEVIMQGDVSDFDITTYEDSVAAGDSASGPAR